MKNASGYIRDLGNAEYFYYLYNKLAPTNFIVVLELIGMVDLDALTKAVNGLFESYDQFHVKIGPESSSRPAFWNTDYQSVKPRVKMGNRSSLDSAILEEVNTPMSPENTPLRLVIFDDGDSKVQYLLFTFNHLFNDAASAVIMVQKVLANAVSGKEYIATKRIKVASNLEQLSPPRAGSIAFLKAIFSMVRRAREKEKKYGRLGHTVSGKYNFQSRNIMLMQAELDNRFTNKLINIARNNGLTVHHLLCAIQLLMVRRLYLEKGILPLTVSMPVNLREMLKPEVDRAIPGLYISIPKLTIPVSDNPVLLELANEVKSELDLTLHSNELFILWRLLPRSKFPNNERGLNKINSTFSKSVDSTMITNLGAVSLWPELELQPPIRSLFFTVAPPKDVMLCLSVSTFLGKMVMSFCFNRDLLSGEVCKRFFQDFNSELAAITD